MVSRSSARRSLARALVGATRRPLLCRPAHALVVPPARQVLGGGLGGISDAPGLGDLGERLGLVSADALGHRLVGRRHPLVRWRHVARAPRAHPDLALLEQPGLRPHLPDALALLDMDEHAALLVVAHDAALVRGLRLALADVRHRHAVAALEAALGLRGGGLRLLVGSRIGHVARDEELLARATCGRELRHARLVRYAVFLDLGLGNVDV